MRIATLFSFALMLMLQSCTEDLCKDVDCGENGTCFEGNCTCLTGYEGTLCDAEWTDKFLGDYVGVLCPLNDPIVNINSALTREDFALIRIANFAGSTKAVLADVINENTTVLRGDIIDVTGLGITMPPDFTVDASTVAYTGEGLYENGSLNFDITITYNSTLADEVSETCGMNYSK